MCGAERFGFRIPRKHVLVWPGVLVWLLACALLVLHVPAVQRFILESVKRRAFASGIVADAADFSFNLLRGAANLRNLSLRSAAPGASPFLTVARLDVSFQPFRLFQGLEAFKEISASGVDVDVVIFGDGTTSLPVTASSGTFKWQSLPELVAVEDGHFRLEDASREVRLDLPRWSFRCDAGRLEFRSETTGELSLHGTTLPVQALQLAGEIEPSGLENATLALDLGVGRAEIGGRIANLQHPKLELRSKMQIGLRELSELLLGRRGAEGRLSAQVHWTGSPGALSGDGILQAIDVRLGTLDPWSGQAQVKLNQQDELLEVEDLALKSGAGSLRASGILSLRASEGASSISVSARGIDLASLMKGFKLTPVFASSASANLTSSWQGLRWESAKGRAKVTFAPRGIAGRGSLRLAGDATLEWDPRGLAVKIDNAAVPGIQAAGGLRLNPVRGTLAGEFFGEITRVAEALRALSDAFPDTLPATDTPLDGSLRWTARIDGSSSNPRILATIDGASLTAGRFHDLGLAGRIEYAAKHLSIPELTVSRDGQSARLTGAIDLGSIDAPVLDLEAGADGVMLGKLVEGLGWDFPIGGRVSAKATAYGPLSRLEGRATIQVDSLSAWRQQLGELEASARLHESEITLDTLQLKNYVEGREALIRASGVLDWERNLLRFSASGDGVRLDSLPLPGDSPLRGDLSFAAQGDGPLSEPRWTARLTASGLSAGGFDVGDVLLDARSDGRSAEISAEATGYSTILHAAVETSDPYSFRMELDSPRFDIGRLGIPTVGGDSLGGSVSVRAWAEGALSQLEELIATASLTDLVLMLDGHEVRGIGPIEARWRNRALFLEAASLAVGDSVIKVGGSLPLSEGPDQGEITVDGTLSLPLIAHLIPRARNVEAEGSAAVRGELRGSLAAIHPSIEIETQDGTLRLPEIPTPVTNLRTRIQFDSTAITVRNAEARLGDGTIRMSGRLPFSAFAEGGSDEMLTARLEVGNFDPAAALAKPASLGGSISFSVDAEGRRADLASLKAQVRFAELTLKSGETTIEQEGESAASLAGGRLTLDHFALRGPNTSLKASGSVGLAGERRIDLKIAGTSEARFLSAAETDFGLTGPIELRVEVGGTMDQPSFRGTADLMDGRFFMSVPPLVAEGLIGHAEFAGQRVTLSNLTGELNGGKVSAEGSASLSRHGLTDLQLKVTATDLFLDFPAGTRTSSNVAAELRSAGDDFLIEGTVQVLEGENRSTIDLQALQRQSPGPRRSDAFLDRIRFNVQVRATAPLVVDNNLGLVNAYADLRLVGTARRPALLGRLELDEGGRVYFAERAFLIDRATVSFTNENVIAPFLNLSARTVVSDYTITFNASGGLRDLETSFSSEPPASEDQILSLLLTGSANNTDRVSTAEVTSRQALSLFGSTAIGGFNLRVRKALGFSEFRIEPSLISADSDPTARLTIGQNLTPYLRLTYSTNLRDSNDRIWIGEYDWNRKVLARYVDRSKDSNRGELLHKLRFGGGPGTGDIRTGRRQKAARLESFEITGIPVFPGEMIARELKLKVGMKFDYLKLQDRLRELKDFYAERGYLEARIRQSREGPEGSVRLTLVIDAGKKISFSYEGAEIDESVRRKVQQTWQAGIVEKQRLDAATALLRRNLFRDGYCNAAVAGRVEAVDPGSDLVIFTISPGARYERVELVFDRLEKPLASEIASRLRIARLDTAVLNNPTDMRLSIQNTLLERGYLSAEVGLPRAEGGKVFRTVVPVRAGPRYRLGQVRFEGNRGIAGDLLARELEIQPGDLYLPSMREDLVQRIEDFYWKRGFRAAVVEVDEEPNAQTGTVDLRFSITENARSILAGLETEGTDQTNETFLRRRVPFSAGDPLDGEKLSQLRRRLLNAGTYSMADLTVRPSEEKKATASEQPVDLIVRVREPKPFVLEYGGTYDSQRGGGLALDFSNRNSLGAGRFLGYRIRGDAKRVDQRVYFSQPFMARRDITSTIDLSRENEFVDDLQLIKDSLTLSQMIEFRRRFTLSYGYRIRRGEAKLKSETVSLDARASATPWIAALSRDTRDNVFDATRGSYSSLAFEYAPGWFGDSLAYYRFFGQYFKYFGLTRPEPVPASDERKSRVVFATGIRTGILDRIGSDRSIIPSERFFGGGGSTVRGFRQNSLGPQLPDGQPLGGQAVFFLNNELRFPFYRFIDSAAFLDIGNVWQRPSDFRLSDLRKSAGFGLRLRNPFILLRFDYGWKLDRMTGESSGAFHFSIGQAF